MDFQSYPHYKFQHLDFVIAAYKEDIPYFDITTDGLGIKERFGKAKIVAKEDLVLSGRDIVTECFLYYEDKAFLRWHFKDGDTIYKDQIICELKGNLIAFLKAERVALNLLGTLSGVSTETRKFVDAVKHTNSKILDTRKIIPLYRDWIKKAVHDGGGTNHRRDLSEMVLIKENHIRAIGGISKAIQKIREKEKGFIEVEVTNLEEVKEAVSNSVDRILLDNMTNDEMKAALQIIPKGVETEASGNMHIDRVASIAELGVTYISVGAITHSAKNSDLSLLFLWDFIDE
jgi:nicotinate-nucleotide pyrophosphorylase (carboxylating)